MGISNHRQQNKTKKTWILACSLATLVFFNNCTTSSFESAASPLEKAKHRLPNTVVKQSFEFDCLKPADKLEVSTDLETIRMEAKNCEEKVEFKNEMHPQPLVTFSMGPQQFASEFAYLTKGANNFSISVSGKSYKVFVHRF
jgi:hypothetical protein